ncbi:NtaA/DmoA family FMN-dependent monooxygenase [Kibdelosporangium philippinense]|uniref:NtaA/DmoA family FMN-dependent monooxygenase n=1 Tax=Kibdelosporangium philippinense TaxID=211113 RepID=A0ABS8ZT56_9PSEU|nr:NtaA/DmoA family FMN-dependent monooxygenase [Kibdelosporangium philippinense]MCE7010423.1 NtaA/DmoA family FMN-dependent monooxygenase [Kibdelosporangium philippinense]
MTTFLAGAGRNLGHGGLPDRDSRYARAEDYVQAVYKLWEHSWEDDAVVRDRDRRQFADPAKVHEINHSGPYYTVYGPHLSEPSPQRTPLLFQAGMSPTGRSFAGRHAEALFIRATTPAAAAQVVADVRRAAAGRAVRIFVPQAYVVGSTEEEARRRSEELLSRQTIEGNLARMSVFLHHDFASDGSSTPVGELRKRPGIAQPVRDLLNATDRDDWTLGELIRWIGNKRLAGTPEQIADSIGSWQAVGVDGINLQYVVSPTSFAEFVDHVVPVLQARGLLQSSYRPGTLREKFFPGNGPRLRPPHPARGQITR